MRADPQNCHARLASLTIVLAIVLTLWPLCFCDFTTWDDNRTVSQNPTLNPPTLHSIKIWWTRSNQDLWDPATYMLNGLLAEVASVAPDPITGIRLNPYVFHTANLILHIGSTLLVFQILRELDFSATAACAAALLFGLHPVQVEPVAWISGIKDVLFVFLSLAAISQYLKRPARISGSQRRSLQLPHYRSQLRSSYRSSCSSPSFTDGAVSSFMFGGRWLCGSP